MNTEFKQPAPAQLIDIETITQALRRGFPIILVSIGAMVVLAILYLVLTSPKYIATATLFVDPRELSITEAKNVVPGLGKDSAAISSQVEVLYSDAILRPVFRDFDFESDPNYLKTGILSRVNGFILDLLGNEPPKETRSRAFEKFLKNIEIERQGVTYIIEVRFTAKTPKIAAGVANAIVDRYIEKQISSKVGASADVNSRMQTRITALRRELGKSEAGVARFRAQNGLVNITREDLIDQQIKQISDSLLAAKTKYLAARSLFESVRRLEMSPKALDRLAELAPSPTNQILRRRYNEISLEIRRLGRTFLARHPDLIALHAERDEVDVLRRQETRRILERLEGSVTESEAETAELSKELARLTSRQTSHALKTIQLRNLERNAKAQRDVLEQFLRRSRETGELSSLQNSNARIITRATQPLDPLWPIPTLILVMAVILGAALGSMLALARKGRKSGSKIKSTGFLKPEPEPFYSPATSQKDSP